MKSGGTSGTATADCRGLPCADRAESRPDGRFWQWRTVRSAGRAAAEATRAAGRPRTALLVLHGLVNNVILSHALGVGGTYFWPHEHSPGCINVLDVGPNDWVIRAINSAGCRQLRRQRAPSRLNTLEKLLAGSLRSRALQARQPRT